MSSSHTDGGGLVARASGGDVDAFMAFYDQTVTATLRLALASSGPTEQAYEAVHDAYVQAWFDSHSHRTTGLSAGAWICLLVRGAVRSRSGPIG